MEEQAMLKEAELFYTQKDLNTSAYKTGELLPCPFCGSSRVTSGGKINEETRNLVYSVTCRECLANVFECLGTIETADEARASVVAKWNRRHNNSLQIESRKEPRHG